MAETPLAFPQSWRDAEAAERHGCAGMSLRDYFAGYALIGVMVMRAAEFGDDISQESIAEEAYELADAMLDAREKGPEEED